MVHQPVVDENKAAELQNRIESLKHPVKKSMKYPPGMSLRDVSALNSAQSVNGGNGLSGNRFISQHNASSSNK